jgi:hypothetical protein
VGNAEFGASWEVRPDLYYAPHMGSCHGYKGAIKHLASIEQLEHVGESSTLIATKTVQLMLKMRRFTVNQCRRTQGCREFAVVNRVNLILRAKGSACSGKIVP